MKSFIRVVWHHDLLDEPVGIISEVPWRVAQVQACPQ